MHCACNNQKVIIKPQLIIILKKQLNSIVRTKKVRRTLIISHYKELIDSLTKRLTLYYL